MCVTPGSVVFASRLGSGLVSGRWEWSVTPCSHLMQQFLSGRAFLAVAYIPVAMVKHHVCRKPAAGGRVTHKPAGSREASAALKRPGGPGAKAWAAHCGSASTGKPQHPNSKTRNSKPHVRKEAPGPKYTGRVGAQCKTDPPAQEVPQASPTLPHAQRLRPV